MSDVPEQFVQFGAFHEARGFAWLYTHCREGQVASVGWAARRQPHHHILIDTSSLTLSRTASFINNNESVNSEAAPRTRCCGANLEEKAGAGLHENSCSALNPHRPVSAANTTFPPSRDYTAGGGS